MPVHYEKIFSDREEEQVRARVRSALKTKGTVVALVFNFVDLMTHGRSESPVLMEVAKDEMALRDLTKSWFERSTLFSVLKEAAAQGHHVLFTTDHGSILCQRPTTVFARRDATSNLRYKFGSNLGCNEKETFLIKVPSDYRLPSDGPSKQYAIAKEDYYFVYPTEFHRYERQYRGSFQHGGISLEEMILPCAVMLPRT